MSRALQSLTSDDAEDVITERRRAHRLASPAPHTHDETELELDVEPAARTEARRLVSGAFDWPHGRTIGVPLTTTVPARP